MEKNEVEKPVLTYTVSTIQWHIKIPETMRWWQRAGKKMKRFCMYLLLLRKHQSLVYWVVIWSTGSSILGKIIFLHSYLTVKIEIWVHNPFSSNAKLKKFRKPVFIVILKLAADSFGRELICSKIWPEWLGAIYSHDSTYGWTFSVFLWRNSSIMGYLTKNCWWRGNM